MGTAGVSSEQKTQTLVITFGIEGNLCYLSHHETVSMLQRALIRAGVGWSIRRDSIRGPGFRFRCRGRWRAIRLRDVVCVGGGREDTAESIRSRLGGASSGGVYSSGRPAHGYEDLVFSRWRRPIGYRSATFRRMRRSRRPCRGCERIWPSIVRWRLNA